MSTVKRELNLQTWEDADFPTVCDLCLGTNPRLRMQKDAFGAECKVCLRPFSTFRWCGGTGERFRRTLICGSCARAKNVCQSCVLDVKNGVPVQVRDTLLGIEDDAPKLETNRMVFFNARAKRPHQATNNSIDAAAVTSYAHKVGANGSAGKEALAKVAAFVRENQQQVAAYRNAPYVCSFFVKGTCNRGAACPYSHDLSAETEQNRTKIMNRYFGVKDAVAEKILQQTKHLLPPALYDRTIASVCIHAVTRPTARTHFGDAAVRKIFERFGDIKSVVYVAADAILFVNFVERRAADAAVEAFLDEGLRIQDATFKVTWAYARPKGATQDFDGDEAASEAAFGSATTVAAESGADAAATSSRHPTTWTLPGAPNTAYTSQDARRLGSAVHVSNTATPRSSAKRPK